MNLRHVGLVAWTTLTLAVPAAATRAEREPIPAPPAPFVVPVTITPPEIDGRLDDEAWHHALRLEIGYEVEPGDNLPPPVRTTAFITSDAENLYVAFHCYDPRPKEIRAHLTDRDQIWRDDWVGIVLDPFNGRRRAYDFLANPVGVQMDFVESEVGGGMDESWDAIWDDAARITDDGWVVEMAIPFRVLRFPRTHGEQTWAFDLTRSYPRGVRHHIGVFPRDRDNNCYLCQAWELRGFADVRPGANLELDPTLTARRTDARTARSEPLRRGDLNTDVGLTARWGATPSLSLAAALNPDFSQVEADAAQLDVNERFALFYPEKRPFFMEGADTFATQLDAVYTRTVADPQWGLKATGKEGPNTAGVFVARDEQVNLLFPANQGSVYGELPGSVTAGVGRWRRDVGESSTLGVLLTARNGTGYANLVYGVDGVLRPTSLDKVSFQVLGSSTEYPDRVADEYGQPHGRFSDHALSLAYEHEARHGGVWAQYQDLGEGFRADLGFIPRVDVKASEVGALRRWWGNGEHWYSRLDLGVQYERSEDQSGMLTDDSAGVFLDFEGPWQSNVHLHPTVGREYWNGHTYDLRGWHFSSSAAPSGSLQIGLFGVFGDAVDYENSRAATIFRVGPSATWRLGRHLALDLEHELERLDVAGGRLYDANLSQLKVVYQLDVRTFVRAIAQYLDLRRSPELYLSPVSAHDRHLFTQLLFSYKLNPQSVLFLGYSDNHFGEHGLDLRETDRTLFLKIGYAFLM